jgi:hypothetical protein
MLGLGVFMLLKEDERSKFVVGRILPELGAVSRTRAQDRRASGGRRKEERMSCLLPRGEERVGAVGLHGTDVEEN